MHDCHKLSWQRISNWFLAFFFSFFLPRYFYKIFSSHSPPHPLRLVPLWKCPYFTLCYMYARTCMCLVSTILSWGTRTTKVVKKENCRKIISTPYTKHRQHTIYIHTYSYKNDDDDEISIHHCHGVLKEKQKNMKNYKSFSEA